MTNCDMCFPKLDAYVDGELSANELDELERHFESCSKCASLALSRLQQKRLTHLAGKKFAPTPEFRALIKKQITKPAPRRISIFETLGAPWKWAPGLATAAALLIVGAMFIQTQRSREQQAYSELADMHIATMASANPVDVVSTDRHTVKPWFQGKLPFTFDIPELANTGFTLLGGRVTYFGQSPAAHLLLRVRQHNISVFVLSDKADFAKHWLNSSKDASFKTRTWTSNGLRYFLITEAPSEDADRLEKLFVDSSRSY
jgi:anti-sigma factor RsiW